MPTDALYSAFSNLDFTRRSEWGVDELRAYVEYLEFKCSVLDSHWSRTTAELTRQRNKASRRKSPPEQPRTIGALELPVGPEVKRKRGRKKKDVTVWSHLARLAIQKRAELEAAGKRVTNAQALKAVCDDTNLLQRDIREITKKRHIINLMSKLRKSF